MSSDPVIQCVDLHKSFIDADLNVTVLNGVNFTLLPGKQTGIVGASGSGKSTLLHILGGLDKPSQGNVLVQGEDVHALSATEAGLLRNRSLGFVYQFHHLLPEFTALENVAMPLLIAGFKASEASERAQAVLADVGLAERLKHKPGKLSGGERQRAAIARAMVTQPACILADEPTGNLDNRTAAQVYELMLSLTEASKVSFVIVTHDLELASKMNETFLLEEGTLRPA